MNVGVLKYKMLCLKYEIIYLLILTSTNLVSSDDSTLFKNGIVHYYINPLDYDVHSQEIIMLTAHQVGMETCLKFFHTSDPELIKGERVIEIANPEKISKCEPDIYDMSQNAVKMVIGYKCMNKKDISRIFMDIIRASVSMDQGGRTADNEVNYEGDYEPKLLPNQVTLLSGADRHFIHKYYNAECGKATSMRRNLPPPLDTDVPEVFGPNNAQYYANKVWPLGIIMYSMEPSYGNTEDFQEIYQQMRHIEMFTCLLFKDASTYEVQPKQQIYFSHSGAPVPHFGLFKGNQSLNLFKEHTSGHSTHVLSSLLRVAGLPYESNRFDRDLYIKINWEHIQSGKEQYFEKDPKEALIRLPYDYYSVMHPPANWNGDAACEMGATTIEPHQDFLWRKTLTMGHSSKFTNSDSVKIKYIYQKECQKRMYKEY